MSSLRRLLRRPTVVAGIIIIGLGIAVRRRGLGHDQSSDQGELFETETFQQSAEEQ